MKEWGLAPSQPRKNSNYRRVARCLSPFFPILGAWDLTPGLAYTRPDGLPIARPTCTVSADSLTGRRI